MLPMAYIVRPVGFIYGLYAVYADDREELQLYRRTPGECWQALNVIERDWSHGPVRAVPSVRTQHLIGGDAR